MVVVVLISYLTSDMGGFDREERNYKLGNLIKL